MNTRCVILALKAKLGWVVDDWWAICLYNFNKDKPLYWFNFVYKSDILSLVEKNINYAKDDESWLGLTENQMKKVRFTAYYQNSLILGFTKEYPSDKYIIFPEADTYLNDVYIKSGLFKILKSD